MIDEFVTPLSASEKEQYQNSWSYTWGGKTVFYDKTQHLNDFDIAIIGVKDARPGVHESCENAPHFVRKALYGLCKNQGPFKLIDIGNIEKGATVQDTQIALKMVVEELIAYNIFPIIIGGAHAFTYGQFLGHAKKNSALHLMAVDEKIDVMPPQSHPLDECFLTDLFMHQPNYLRHFTALAYQSYFVPDEALATIEKLNFDLVRLGKIRDDFNEIEPLLRSAHLLSFDVCALKSSEAPGQCNPTPNGLYGEEACQMMQYAGVSENIGSLGIYNYHPEHDVKNQTALLIAQMIWYFVEGYYHRIYEIPDAENDNFLVFNIFIEEAEVALLFIKSKLSGRWWLQAPDSDKNKHWIPCTYKDYEQAAQNEIPDKWNNYLWRL